MRLPAAIILLAIAFAAAAQTTWRWTDKEGRVHYTDEPPAPGEAAKVEQKRSVPPGADETASYALRKAMTDYPVTLYTQPNCGDICKDGRDHLTRRGVPFSEKSVTTDADLKALRALGGEGELVVPLLQVGTKTWRGYLSTQWDSLLDAAGYPKAAAKAAAGR